MPAPTSEAAPGSEPRTRPDDRPEKRLDPRLAEAVETARAAAEEEANSGDVPVGSPLSNVEDSDEEAVGEHAGVDFEDGGAATHHFETNYPGYVGWRWAVTVATSGPDHPVTVSEVVLLPGPNALRAPDWVPWSERVRPGDLGAGDLLPSEHDDHRLAQGSLPGDDSLDELAHESEAGRNRVLSKEGRSEAADRWSTGDFGPETDTARLAPGSCASCGFFLPLAGSMRAAFGVCGNSVSPADGHVVHVDFGCGAHSEAEVDTSSTVPVAEVVYDDTNLDYETRDPHRE